MNNRVRDDTALSLGVGYSSSFPHVGPSVIGLDTRASKLGALASGRVIRRWLQLLIEEPPVMLHRLPQILGRGLAACGKL